MNKQIGAGPRVLNTGDLTYNSYLKVPELLALQRRVSEPAEHDEMLFIIIHQAFELWFKQIIHELEVTREKMHQKEVLQAHHHLRRVVEIQKLLIPQIHILETMRPTDFLRFRDRLNPASGFQSLQFREVEFLLGLKEERYLQFFQNNPEVLTVLKTRLAEEDIKMAFYNMLIALGFDIPADAAKKEEDEAGRTQILKALKKIYENLEANLPLYLLIETLVDLDTNLSLWRTHHVQVVERLIGGKMGTGGSSGVDYLKRTTSKKCFPLLWEVRTLLEKK